MNVRFLNPFVEAAFEVIAAETAFKITRGELGLEKDAYLTDDITVIISLVGQVEGNVFYSMPAPTGLALASRILGERMPEFDTLAQSGVAELANVITGRASVKLAEAGYDSTISPPTMLQGKGARISTLDYARLLVPLTGECGTFVIHLALREAANPGFSAAKTPVAKSNFAW
jgi:chemotaxis protein CheX